MLNCVTLRALPSTSVSFASTLPDCGASSNPTPTSFTATGASLTGVTFSVIRFGSVSNPPAVSCTLNVNDA